MANLCFKTLGVEQSRHGGGILSDRCHDNHALVFVDSRNAFAFVVSDIIHQQPVHWHTGIEIAARWHPSLQRPFIICFSLPRKMGTLVSTPRNCYRGSPITMPLPDINLNSRMVFSCAPLRFLTTVIACFTSP